MCCILYFPIGSSIDYNKLKNCVYNNCHSFGAVLKNPKHKKIEVIKKCDWQNNETPVDPDEVFNLINNNKEMERYIHLRWRTDGPIDLDNTHPFPVYYSDKRSVYFMHNGILHGFKPTIKSTTYVDGVKIEKEGEDISDSKKFVDTFLTPLLTRFIGENGKADISDSLLSEIIDKFWSSGSKGILISSDQDPHIINPKDWHKIEYQGNKFLASNDTYFDKILRGPEADRIRKEEEAKRKEQNGGNFSYHSGTFSVADLKTIPLMPREPLSKELKSLFEDYKIWETEGIASLANLTAIEIETLVKDHADDATNLIIYLTSYYKEMYDKYMKATNYIKSKQKGDTV